MSDAVAVAAPPVAATSHEVGLRAETGAGESLGHDTYEAGLGHDTYVVGENGGGLGELDAEGSAVAAPDTLEMFGNSPSPLQQQMLQPPPHDVDQESNFDCCECLESVGELLECIFECIQCMSG